MYPLTTPITEPLFNVTRASRFMGNSQASATADALWLLRDRGANIRPDLAVHLLKATKGTIMPKPLFNPLLAVTVAVFSNELSQLLILKKCGVELLLRSLGLGLPAIKIADCLAAFLSPVNRIVRAHHLVTFAFYRDSPFDQMVKAFHPTQGVVLDLPRFPAVLAAPGAA